MSAFSAARNTTTGASPSPSTRNGEQPVNTTTTTSAAAPPVERRRYGASCSGDSYGPLHPSFCEWTSDDSSSSDSEDEEEQHEERRPLPATAGRKHNNSAALNNAGAELLARGVHHDAMRYFKLALENMKIDDEVEAPASSNAANHNRQVQTQAVAAAKEILQNSAAAQRDAAVVAQADRIQEDDDEIGALESSKLVGLAFFPTPLTIDDVNERRRRRSGRRSAHASPSDNDEIMMEDNNDDDFNEEENAAAAAILFNISLLHMRANPSPANEQTVQSLEIALQFLRPREDDLALRASDPPVPTRLELMVLTNLGYLLYRRGKYQAASDRLREAANLTEALLPEEDCEPSSSYWRLYVANVNVARALIEAGGTRNVEEARGRIEAAEDMAACFAEGGGCQGQEGQRRTSPRVAVHASERSAVPNLLYVKAMLHRRRGNVAGALECFKRCVLRHTNDNSDTGTGTTHRQTSSTSITNKASSLRVAAALHGMGELLAERGAASSVRPQEDPSSALSQAAEALARCLRLRVEILGESHPDVADALRSVGLVRRLMGLYGESVDAYHQALSVRMRLSSSASDEQRHETALLELLCELAEVLRLNGRLEDGLVICRYLRGLIFASSSNNRSGNAVGARHGGQGERFDIHLARALAEEGAILREMGRSRESGVALAEAARIRTRMAVMAAANLDDNPTAVVDQEDAVMNVRRRGSAHGAGAA